MGCLKAILKINLIYRSVHYDVGEAGVEAFSGPLVFDDVGLTFESATVDVKISVELRPGNGVDSRRIIRKTS